MVAGPIRLDHPQGTAGHVGDSLAGGVGARVDHRIRSGQVPGLAAGDIHRPQAAGQREDRQPGGLVGGVAGDARTVLASTLTPDAFLFRQQFRGTAGQFGGVSEQPLRPGAGFQRPQAADRVVTRPAAQEQHPRPVRGNREVVRDAQSEELGPGKLAGQRNPWHADTLPRGTAEGATLAQWLSPAPPGASWGK
jgi:hypothetical protein